MGYICAVTGKGGVGKTMVSALLTRQLIKNGREPVLAIDADPNSCLDSALGVKAGNTVGRAREEVRDAAADAAKSGISKQDLLQYKIAESLVEADCFDLIAMGRPEGAGCYCYANNVLKNVIAEIANEYPYVILDNEAGLENLSRRIVLAVDMLVLVSDASNAGLKTLARLHDLALEMGTEYKKLILVINRLRSGALLDSIGIQHGDSGVLPDSIKEIMAATGADGIIGLPDDSDVAEYNEQGHSLLGLPDDNRVVVRIDGLARIMG